MSSIDLGNITIGLRGGEPVYTVDGAEYSATDLAEFNLRTQFAAVGFGGALQLEEQIDEFMKKMQKNSELTSVLNQVLEKMSGLRPDLPTDTAELNGIDVQDADGKSIHLGDFLNKHSDELGLSQEDIEAYFQNGTPLDQKKFDQAMDKIKGALDTLNNISHEDAIKLQSYTNKLNQCYEMMSNFFAKMSKNLEGIMANIRG